MTYFVILLANIIPNIFQEKAEETIL